MSLSVEAGRSRRKKHSATSIEAMETNAQRVTNVRLSWKGMAWQREVFLGPWERRLTEAILCVLPTECATALRASDDQRAGSMRVYSTPYLGSRWWCVGGHNEFQNKRFNC